MATLTLAIHFLLNIDYPLIFQSKTVADEGLNIPEICKCLGIYYVKSYANIMQCLVFNYLEGHSVLFIQCCFNDFVYDISRKYLQF